MLPTSISPNTIVQAIAEIRFESAIPQDAVFGQVYAAFSKEYPTVRPLDILNLPLQIRESNPELAFSATHQMLGSGYFLQVGPRVFHVAISGNYTRWSDFRSRIMEAYGRIHSLPLVSRVVRTSLRYMDFFEGDVLPKLQTSFSLEDHTIAGRETMFRTVYPSHGFDTILQINNTSARVVDGAVTQGSVTDIDVLAVSNPDEVFTNTEDLLQRMHLCGKTIFFSLLKPDFLKTLNPTYE